MRFLLLAAGSHGDIHPAIAVARALREQGAEAVLATNPYFERVITDAGVPFAPFGETIDLGKALQTPGVMSPRLGPIHLMRRFVLPTLAQDAATLGAILDASKPDCVVVHPLSLHAPPVCEARGIPWAGTSLAPISWWNPNDNTAPSMYDRSRSPVWLSRASLAIGKFVMRAVIDGKVNALRRSLGLPKGKDHFVNLCRGGVVNLGLWSPAFRTACEGDPPSGVVTGFPWFDRVRAHDAQADELREFLDQGAAPIIFTLGTAAVHVAGNFYESAAQACGALGARGVLLVGKHEYAPRRVPAGVGVFTYAPFSEVFPRCRVLVHHGGIGTTAQALRAGRPQLIVPMAHDQFDNAARVKRLGAGQRIAHPRVTPKSLTDALRVIVDDPSYAREAALLAPKIASEDGASNAARILLTAAGGGQQSAAFRDSGVGRKGDT